MKTKKSKLKTKNYNLKLKTFLVLSYHFAFCILSFALLTLPANAAVMSNVELTSITNNSMIVTWTTTDEASATEILYGIGSLTETTSVAGTTKYHYIEIDGLYPNTTYQYKIKSNGVLYPPESLPPLSFKTLEEPAGEYLFSFAVLNDTHYAEGKSNVRGARGIPYLYCAQIISSEVSNINTHNVAFTVVNGDLADSDNATTYGDQIGVNLKNRLENLSGAADLPSGSAYKYLPTPGSEDKNASYSNDWITDAFQPLTADPGTTESRYGYSAAAGDDTKNSVFNYQFKYNYYNFIFLDSVRTDGTGLASIEAVTNYLSNESNTKTFVFMNYPAYDMDNIDGERDYIFDLPTEEVGVLKISNHEEFRSTIEAFKDTASNPIVAAVVSGHIGDNYKRDINDISYVRQGPAVGFPTGYSIYKVYTNGYIKTFYKTTGRDSSDKPYYEHARDQISAEADFAAEALSTFWLGTDSNRNFTYTYPFIPGVAPKVLNSSPVTAETAVALNSPIIIRFNKRMSKTDLNSWVTVSPSVGTITASFLDTERTILKVNHSSNFVVDTNYTATVLAAKARDEGSTPMAANFVLTFNTTGGTEDTEAPVARINPLPSNSTIDPFPSFSGVATDESGVANIEYRFDDKDWATAEALDGTFSSTTEPFKLSATDPLSTGSHQVWLRTSDGAGNVSDATLAYSFTVAEEKPNVSVKIDGSTPISGDPISATPKIEITIIALNTLTSARLTVDSTTSSLTYVSSGSNYYATHEVTSALADGIHGITIEAFDNQGEAATYEVFPLYVQGGKDITIQGSPLNFPNPFDPGKETTAIGYTLSKPGDITLSIFDLSGNLIVKKNYVAGQAGGKVGYNEVAWDGKSDSGAYVGNGLYVFLIIADGKVVQNGKGKIAVFKQ